MQIIGRITKDAAISHLKDDRQVVNFSVAVNDWYKPKNGELKKFTLFVNCSYWISTKIAAALVKGAIVEVNGRPYLNTYTDMKGEAKASLNCHASAIKIHSSVKKENATGAEEVPPQKQAVAEDLPF